MLMDEKKNGKKKDDFDIDPNEIKALFKKFFDNFGEGFVEIPFPPTDSNIKDFNYSFKFDSSNMDNPEIKFNGSTLDINKIKEFLSNNLSDSVFNKGNPEIIFDARDIQNRTSNSAFIEPIYDIINNKTDNLVEIVVELPGISEKNVKIHYLGGNEIVIIGENEEKTFRKSFKLKFIPNQNKTEISSKNNIFRIILREHGEK